MHGLEARDRRHRQRLRDRNSVVRLRQVLPPEVRWAQVVFYCVFVYSLLLVGSLFFPEAVAGIAADGLDHSVPSLSFHVIIIFSARESFYLFLCFSTLAFCFASVCLRHLFHCVPQRIIDGYMKHPGTIRYCPPTPPPQLPCSRSCLARLSIHLPRITRPIQRRAGGGFRRGFGVRPISARRFQRVPVQLWPDRLGKDPHYAGKRRGDDARDHTPCHGAGV